MSDAVLDEYSTRDAVHKYTTQTAGYGISYLLENDYARIYGEVLRHLAPPAGNGAGIRILEFGCGGAMNLIRLLRLAEQLGTPVQEAMGTDFSETLIDAANREADAYLDPSHRARLKLLVARNERLADDLAAHLGVPVAALAGAFHLVLGVNTVRYSHRLGKQFESARALFDLLAKGGVCVVIDMNRRFPLFRSRLRGMLAARPAPEYVPDLDEYVRPFAAAGFDVLHKGNFCWIPHSAGVGLTTVCRSLTPLLDAVVPARAMRSLFIARKPA